MAEAAGGGGEAPSSETRGGFWRAAGRGMFRQPIEKYKEQDIQPFREGRYTGYLWTGSPWERSRVPVGRTYPAMTDLDVSYLDEEADERKRRRAEEAQPRRPPRGMRWQNPSAEPHDLAGILPSDWSTEEPDLDPNDYNAQIVRCNQRIADNIFPGYFMMKRAKFEKMRQNYTALREKWGAELDWAVVLRLEALEAIRNANTDKRDPGQQNGNIFSIMTAYRDGSLHVNRLVTYWWNGVRICQPRPFDWIEFMAIHAEHAEGGGFWVEGLADMQNAVRGLRIALQAPGISPMITPPRHHFYKIACRIPGCRWWVAFDFMLDTGASMMDIYRTDLNMLRVPEDAEPPGMGLMQVKAGYGRTYTWPVIHLEVCLLDEDRERMTPWTRTTAMYIDDPDLDPTNDPTAIRSDGPLFRHMLYHTFVPNNKHEVVISETQLGQHLPKSKGMNKRRMPNRYNWSSTATPDYGDVLPAAPDSGKLGVWPQPGPTGPAPIPASGPLAP